MANPSFFSEGNTPKAGDPRWRILQKILGAVIDAGGSTGAGGVTVAAGAPPVDGSVTTLFYKDTDTGFKYINLGTAAAPDWDAI